MMSAATIRSAVSGLALIAGGGALAALAACGGSTDVTNAPAKDVTPATITASTTDTIRGVAGTAAGGSLTVTVKNKAGDLLDTTLVTFAVTAGGGSVANPTARTNAAGQASTTWTLGGTVGVQTVTATAGTLAPVTFVAVATAGAPTGITKVTGDAQSAAVNTNVQIAPSVKIADGSGNPVSGVVVTFAVGLGGGSVTPLTVTTAANGIATVGSWRLGANVGTNTLVASAGSLNTTFTATGTVGAAVAITLTASGPSELNIGQTVTITPRVVDASGNVLTNPAVTYASSNAGVASVSATGVITGAGAGNATITATSGTVSANFAVTVIGHPSGTSISNTIQLAALPGDVAFTNSAMLVAISGLNQVLVMDPTATTTKGTITLSTALPLLVAPTKAATPAIGVNIGTTSRIWFIDPTVPAATDSLDLPEIVINQGAAVTSAGTRAFVMLNNGNLAVIDGATHAQLPSITLGGGITKILLASGDSLLYAFTNIGIIFEIDVRNNVVRRQIIINVPNTDVAISRDGTLFYFLDGPGNVVRILSVATSAIQRAVGISANGSSLAVSPDGQQIWVVHSNPQQVTIYTGSLATGFLSTGGFTTMSSLPIRVYFSPTGSLAAVTNFGGWVDIVR